MKIFTTNLKGKLFPYSFFLFNLLPGLFLIQVNAQTFSVSGKITASRFPVQQANVTFIDNSDTTKKYSTLTDNSGDYLIDLPTAVEPYSNNLPDKFELEQNYPNPFSTSTAIPYNIQKPSDDIRVTIYDILGREVKEFTVGQQSTGLHSMLWDGKNNFGQKVTNGVYFYRLQAGNESQVKKMVFNSGGKDFVSLPGINFSPKLNSDNENNKFNDETTYTVRIENGDNTLPVIIPKQLDNIQVNSNTTMNFIVDYILTAAVILDSLHQIIRGFGGANILGWTPGLNYGDMTRSELQTAFGTGEGQLGFTILRLRISPNSTEFGLNIPSARIVDSLGGIVIASPWTPPPSMKTNGSTVSGELKESSYSDYAAHLKSFADYMTDNNAPLYAISIQNEPDANVTYESCDWNGTQLLNFMKNNAASIGYRIMMPESQNFVHALSDPTLNDSVACANVSFIAGHIYGGGLGQYSLAEEKGKEVWMTEYLINSPGSGENMDTSLASAIATAKSITNCMNSNMSAYVWWWIVRYYGPIDDGTKGGVRGTVTRKGYVMSQFARFIRPGDYRVDCSIYPFSSSVYLSAYTDSSSSKKVIVAVNSSSSDQDVAFTFRDGTVNSLTPYTTTLTKNVEQGDNINVNDNKIIITLKGSSVTTFISN
ncbi:T9SS type A sorting domain-containing protein [bacterium BMS3Abin03]|nr:T9SS type A sorting domain-containing protein [bacterium BMS3Abin03]